MFHIQKSLGPFFCFNAFFPKGKNYKLLFDETQNRIKKELDVVKLITSMRNMKTFLKSTSMNEEIRFKIRHSKKNWINIDLSDHDHVHLEDDDEEGNENEHEH